MPSLAHIAEYLDTALEISAIPDYPNAFNGVQLANLGDIERVACAVDFSGTTIEGAIAAGARLLLVHHGMFWSGVQPIVGARHRNLWTLVTHDVAVYAAHLPLDLHPQFGNNALLARQLGLQPSGGFAAFQGRDVGVRGTSEIDTVTLVERARGLAQECGGQLVVTPFAERHVTHKWGVCTGAGASSSSLREAASLGLDTLIVGEGPHHTAVEARELGIVVMYAGHYATETLGVRALGAELERRFGVTSSFIDAPTGL